MGYLYQTSYEELKKVTSLDDLKVVLKGHKQYQEMLNDVPDPE